MLLQSHKGCHRYRYEMLAETVWMECGVEKRPKQCYETKTKHPPLCLPLSAHSLPLSASAVKPGESGSRIWCQPSCLSNGMWSLCGKGRGDWGLEPSSSGYPSGVSHLESQQQNSTDVINTLTSEDRNSSLLIYNNKKRKKKQWLTTDGIMMNQRKREPWKSKCSIIFRW